MTKMRMFLHLLRKSEIVHHSDTIDSKAAERRLAIGLEETVTWNPDIKGEKILERKL